MGILINGEYKWQVGDIVYCQVNDYIKGQFVIQKVLTNGCYRGRLLKSKPGDFATEFMVSPGQLKPVPGATGQG